MSQSTPTTAVDEFADHTKTPMQRVQSTLHKYPWVSPFVVLALLIVIFTVLGFVFDVGSLENFFKPGTVSLMLQQTVIVGTLAIAQTIIILTAGIDLSIGAILVFGQMVMANLAVYATASNVLPIAGQNPVLAVFIGILVATLAGALNGFLVVRFNLPPFIVTLGTLSIFTALTLILFKARTIQGKEMPEFMLLMNKDFQILGIGITLGLLVMIGLYILFAYVLRGTAWGTHVYAVGNDPAAAELSGINVKRVLFSVYVVAGVVIGIAAWITIGRTGSASPNVAPDINLETITAVVIGGTSLFGGRGRLFGTLIGTLIIVVLDFGLSLAGLDQAYRVLAIGILVIVAVAVDQWIRKVKV
ncbi:MAG: ABC transporter permease [Candidatus Nanopelagicales bacterium]